MWRNILQRLNKGSVCGFKDYYNFMESFNQHMFSALTFNLYFF
jgi:hypothetical protein